MNEQPAARRQPQPAPGALRPPRYVNVPVELAWCDGNETVLVTLIRIVGLCWQRGGRRAPSLSYEEVARALHRTPRTLRRHLNHLEDQGWVEVDRQGDRVILRPRLDRLPPLDRVRAPSSPRPPQAETAAGAGPSPGPGVEPDPALQEALDEVGIVSPVREHLAREPNLDPVCVRAWHLWTQHPERASLQNPAGYIVRQLQAGHAPPDPYPQLVSLTGEQIAQLRISRWTGDQDLDDDLWALLPTFLELFPEG